MEIKIRKASKEDIPQLVRLWKEFAKYHENLSPFYEKKTGNAHKKWAKYVKAKKIGKRNSVIFVAVKNKKIVGYANANVKKNKPVYKIKRYGVFGQFFVLSEYRGKGVGTMLKNKVLDLFRSKRLKYVEIGVLAANKKTKKVYEHWGFKDYIIKMRKRL